MRRVLDLDAVAEVRARDFLERQEAVAVFAVVDEAGLERRLDARHHRLVDVALALLAPFELGLEVEQLLAIDDGQAPLFRLRGVDQHAFHVHSSRCARTRRVHTTFDRRRQSADPSMHEQREKDPSEGNCPGPRPLPHRRSVHGGAACSARCGGWRMRHGATRGVAWLRARVPGRRPRDVRARRAPAAARQRARERQEGQHAATGSTRLRAARCLDWAPAASDLVLSAVHGSGLDSTLSLPPSTAAAAASRWDAARPARRAALHHRCAQISSCAPLPRPCCRPE